MSSIELATGFIVHDGDTIRTGLAKVKGRFGTQNPLEFSCPQLRGQ